MSIILIIIIIIIFILLTIMAKEHYLGSFEHAAPKGYDFSLRYGLTLDDTMNYIKNKNQINSYLCKNKIN